MKQILTKIFLGGLGLGLLGYVGRLFSQHNIVVTKDIARNLGGMMFAGLIALYILLLIAQPQFAPRSKGTLAVAGIVVVIVAHLIYQDNASNYVYLRDIMKIFGVLLIVGGASGLFHDQKVIEQRKMQEAEIIEI